MDSGQTNHLAKHCGHGGTGFGSAKAKEWQKKVKRPSIIVFCFDAFTFSAAALASDIRSLSPAEMNFTGRGSTNATTHILILHMLQNSGPMG